MRSKHHMIELFVSESDRMIPWSKKYDFDRFADKYVFPFCDDYFAQLYGDTMRAQMHYWSGDFE